MKKIAITTGDPAGIGAEIVAKSLRFFDFPKDIIFIVYGENYKNMLTVKQITSPENAIHPNTIYHINIGEKIEKGAPSKQSGNIAYQILKRVARDLKGKKLDAVVTAPIAKSFIKQNIPDFIGHTEFFAKESGLTADDVIMSFWSDTFNLLLLTTHLSVKDAIDRLTYDFIYKKLKKIVLEIHKVDKTAKIAILGTNPHAGENGNFGETDEIVKKVLKKINYQKQIIDGPFPADSFFSATYRNYKFIISPLHDLGLIPFKLLNFSEGVNVTLGLGFVRTSPDHGTAFDIAPKGIADETSMRKAIDYAIYLLSKRQISTTQYSAFAKYYDKYMEHVDYDKWIEFILKKYEEFSDFELKTIFELACGTANISTGLVKKGYTVFASDNSVQMLKIADSKPNKPILFYHDFLKPLPQKNLDLVILIFDSLNYISQETDIKRLFENVYNALKYNGIFIFDISTVKNCEDNFDGFVNLEDNDKNYFIHESAFTENKLISKLTFFEKHGYLYKRLDEKHIQHIYKVETIIKLINESNLNLKGYFAPERAKTNLYKTPLSYEEIDFGYDRIFFVVKKEI